MKKIICLALVFLFVFSLAAIVLHTHHDCSGDDCPVCCILKLCQSLFRALVCLFTFIGAFSSYAAIKARLRAFYNTGLFPVTLVALKVKLSN